jgi:uncharacterized protein DUF541
MRKLIFMAVLLAGSALAQQPLDANSIVVTAAKGMVLIPTDVTFMLNVSADLGLTLDQVLAAIDLGVTAQDLVGINSYPTGPYPPVPSSSRINYVFRLSVPFSRMKDSVDKLEKLRKTLDTGMDLNYSTSTIGPSQAAVQDAHDKALPDLIADAKRRAQALAGAAQLKLGAIQSVNEAYSYTGGVGPLPANVNFSIVVRFAAQ